MFYYKNREDFESDPSKSIKNRPISIVGYQIFVLSQDGEPPFEFELRVSTYFAALVYMLMES
jgi:hypothetical protein